MVGASSTRAEAERLLNEWAERADSEPRFADLVYESSARAWMAGQLFVRNYEVPAEVRKLAVEVGQDGAFLSMPFQDALERFLARLILPPEEAFDALGRLRERAFSARRLATESVRQSAFDALVTALEGGGDYQSFAAAIRDEEISLGISPSNHGYLRTVFDTNVVSAYSAGRDRQLTEPAVIEALPYRIYVAVIDARTRASHAALDGKTWDARKTDEWRKYQGPNGFNCRCQVVSAAEPDNTAALSMRAVHPDEAFNSAPSLEI